MAAKLDPKLSSTLPAISDIFSTIGNTYATAQAQGVAAKWEQFKYGQQQWAADQNRQFAELMSEDAIRRGDRAALEHRKKIRQLIGSQRAALAAQGIDVNSGSAMDTQMDTATLGAYDVETIKNNAWREAWGLKTQASQYATQAAMAGISGGLAGFAGQQAQQATYLTGGLSALNSGLKGYALYKGAIKPDTTYLPER